MDKNCLSYWFPLLQASGVITPRTEIVRTDIFLAELLDGRIPGGWGGFLADLGVAIGRLTGNAAPPPAVFLRTGHGSGKHDWRRTCYLDLAAGDTLADHVAALVRWSDEVGVVGLATNVWAVREFLPLEVAFHAEAYGGMPVAREYRAFMVGGRLQCVHPYWPERAVLRGRPDDPDWRRKWRWMSDIDMDVYDLVGAIVGRLAPHFAGTGDWSVDVCPTRDGRWCVTDCAQAERSFHWPDCPHCPEGRRPAPGCGPSIYPGDPFDV